MNWFSSNKENSLNSPQARAAVVVGLTILYVAAFLVYLHKLGPVSAALITVPVALTGYYFGVRAGLLAGIIGAALSAWLFQFTEGYNWLTWLLDGWPGNIMILLVGFISGLLRQGMEQRSQVEAELRSRERYFALVNIMTQSILSAKTTEDTYYLLASHLTNLFEADYAFIIQWDGVRNQPTILSTTLVLEGPVADIRLEPHESAAIESVLHEGHALAIEDVPPSKHGVIGRLSPKDDGQLFSTLCIPLISGAYRFGAAVVAYNSSHHFTSEEVRRAEQAGKNVTLALGSIEQKEEIQKRLKETNALANIEHALSETEKVGLETVLQLIVDSAKELIRNAEQAVIHLLDDEQQYLIPKAVAKDSINRTATFNMRPGEGAAGLAIAEKEVINIQDVAHDPRFLHAASPPAFRSLLVAPIQRKGQSIGTISVQSADTHAFSEKDSELINTLSIHAALAIENAHLLETTRQHLTEVNALYQISQGLAASIDSDQLIKNAVDLLQKNFGYEHVQIYILDSQSGELVFWEGTGKVGPQPTHERYQVSSGAGVLVHVARTGEPFMTNDIDQVSFFGKGPVLPDTKCELTVPIKIENQVVGILDIQQSSGHINEDQLHLVSAVADQLAAALQKANLYADLQHSLNQEKAMRIQLVQSEKLAVMGRLLASVSHELNNPLQAIQNALFLLREEKGISFQGKQDLEIVLSESERMAALIERLRATYRPHQIQDFHPVQLNNIIESVFALIATHLRHNQISFEFYPDPELPPLPGLANELREVLLNLLMNAVEAMTNGGRLSVSTQYLSESCEALLVVADNGPGVDASILPNIFDAFVTNKASGTGLGLTISYDIIQKHRGRIKAENDPEGGTIFSIWLPVKLGTFDDDEQPYLDH